MISGKKISSSRNQALDSSIEAQQKMEFIERCNAFAAAFQKDPSIIKTLQQNDEAPLERNVKEAFDKKGLKPDLCERHGRIFVLDCFSCTDGSKKLCYHCLRERNGNHKGHKVKVIHP